MDCKGHTLIGRKAELKEFGIFEITNKNKEIVVDTVKAFALASRTHNDDVGNILQQIKEKWKQ